MRKNLTILFILIMIIFLPLAYRAQTGPEVITTFAGGGADENVPANSPLLAPSGIAKDSAGNIYIIEGRKHRIRKLDALTGTISTYAGNGTSGFSGDGGPATSASFNLPLALAIDGE